MSEDIYLGVGSHVVCIDPRNGGEKWRTKVKRADPITLLVSGDLVIAYAGGSLFAIRKENGQPLWYNDLPGLGYGRAVIATASSSNMQGQTVSAAAASAAAAAAASTSASAAHT